MPVRKDPTFLEVADLTKTEQACLAYCQELGLLATPPVIGFTRKNPRQPVYARWSDKPFNPNKPACASVVVLGHKDGVPKYRCTVCRNVHHGISVIMPNVADTKSFFIHIDSSNRPNHKVGIRDILFVIWALAYEIPLNELSSLSGCTISKSVLIYWANYVRELTMLELNNADPMGGFGDILECDESYLRGKRKGPWIFGVTCRRTKETRLFHVPDRTGVTLYLILRQHTALGSSIYSDEWIVYLRLMGYHHSYVNHSLYFKCPRTGARRALSVCGEH